MRRQRITSHTPTTRTEHIFTAIFWLTVLGWPLFVAVYRWLH